MLWHTSRIGRMSTYAAGTVPRTHRHTPALCRSNRRFRPLWAWQLKVKNFSFTAQIAFRQDIFMHSIQRLTCGDVFIRKLKESCRSEASMIHRSTACPHTYPAPIESALIALVVLHLSVLFQVNKLVHKKKSSLRCMFSTMQLESRTLVVADNKHLYGYLNI